MDLTQSIWPIYNDGNMSWPIGALLLFITNQSSLTSCWERLHIITEHSSSYCVQTQGGSTSQAFITTTHCLQDGTLMITAGRSVFAVTPPRIVKDNTHAHILRINVTSECPREEISDIFTNRHVATDVIYTLNHLFAFLIVQNRVNLSKNVLVGVLRSERRRFQMAAGQLTATDY